MGSATLQLKQQHHYSQPRQPLLLLRWWPNGGPLNASRTPNRTKELIRSSVILFQQNKVIKELRATCFSYRLCKIQFTVFDLTTQIQFGFFSCIYDFMVFGAKIRIPFSEDFYKKLICAKSVFQLENSNCISVGKSYQQLDEVIIY